MRAVPVTFERKTDASRWLSLKETEVSKGEWIAPELGKQKFHEYAEQWMRERVLKPRSAELDDGLLANHLYPTFGNLGLSDVDEVTIRRWRKARLEVGPKAKRPFGPVTVAKAHRLLHAIFETAAEDDRFIPRNPCHIDGAGKEEPTNGRLSRCQSSSRSPKRFRSGTAPWSCSPPPPICAGVSWPGSGAKTSTWTRARSASRKPFRGPTRAV